MGLFIAFAVAYGLVVVSIVQKIITRRAQTPTPKSARILPLEWGLRLASGVFIIQYACGYILDFVPTPGIQMPLWGQILGLAIYLSGVLLVAMSHVTLGRNWIGGIGHHADHQLVTNGPYAFVRNPIYDGYGIVMLGLAVASGNLGVLIGSVCYFAALASRIPHEEVIMAEHFEEDWDQYKASTPALIPRFR